MKLDCTTLGLSLRMAARGVGLTSLTLLLCAGGALAQVRASLRCDDLASMEFEVSKVVETEIVAGEFRTPTGQTMENLPEFCRVVIHTSFSTDSSVNSELWLPVSGWNGRFLGTGNGGMAGAIRYTSFDAGIPDGRMAGGLRKGFAVANTDMGTSHPEGEPFPVLDHPVKWWDYGRRSTHEMTVVSKKIVQAFYGQPAEYSYFSGCSTGGFQSLRLVQDHPHDYDGILAGHPGPNRSAKVVGIQYNYMLPKLFPEGRIPNDKLMLMHKAVLNECAGSGGGHPTDPFLTSPYECKWDPSALLCTSTDETDCLTEAQVEMANRYYLGFQSPRTKEFFFPGLPRGTELGWEEYMVAADEEEPPHAGVTRSILGSDFDFWKSDWDRDAETFIQIMSQNWNTTETDLSRFQNAGGKLLMFFGYNDTSTSHDTTNYYEAVRAGIQSRGGLETGTALTEEQAQQRLQSFYRLFMMPGMEHCRGGNGPNAFDGLAVLTKWVEEGVSPDRITAEWRPRPNHFPASLGAPMTRPLCLYPKVAHYKGSGDTASAESFVCK